ncbi:rolling circle replication-associated protein [Luteolibacter luteus]|uniref:Replication-associated protein ORF2/G2P domain-containing protein n=1 Tax=Luteolibacter luteus TaxID=2728835 RepID=A0A858RPD9_9BACT|nr:hypothetical protein [Luteolibacter luteus]QJE98877.1 hypothetical protein HHL09_24885 [Luteolibacter luteus]
MIADIGFEGEHRGSAYRLSREQSPSLRGGELSPSRVPANDAGIHCRQSAAALRSRLVHVRAYDSPNWLTPGGVAKKRRAIERKGMPRMKHWRMITLTLNRELFEHSPLAGYLEGKDHLRRFMFACRKAGLWSDEHKWAWKFEFHEDGWPHWHLFVARTEKFDQDEDFPLINRLWGLGRANVKMIDRDEFLYEFKYAFKPAVQVDEDDIENYSGAAVAPGWFLDHLGIKTVTVRWKDEEGIEQRERAIKPSSFARVRFWQTSKGFYTSPEPVKEVERKPQQNWQIPFPVRVTAERISSTVQVVARDSGGTYVASSVVKLSCRSGDFWNLVGWHTVHGAAVGLGVNSYAIPAFLIQSKTHNACQLHHLLQKNRFSHLAAERLQREGQTLRTS